MSPYGLKGLYSSLWVFKDAKKTHKGRISTPKET